MENNKTQGRTSLKTGDYEQSTEESPLLSNGSASEDAGALEAGEGGDTGQQWPGKTDFEGLPWWKSPSVGPEFFHDVRESITDYNFGF